MGFCVNRDQIYGCHNDLVESFCFDQAVVSVFQDMIRRSVPGYGMVLSLITVLGDAYLMPETVVYDLGSSLGASSLALSGVAAQRDCTIIAVDNSSAMIDQCKQNFAKLQPACEIELINEDINRVTVVNASMVMMNFTLQFIDPKHRDTLLDKVYQGLLPGGVLMLSEKVVGESLSSDNCLVNLHHGFKMANGYSELEISQKRTALEGVMITEKLSTHIERLQRVGFTKVEVIFRALNFVSMVAFK